MTTLRWMITVAMGALIVCGYILWGKHVTYQRRAVINAIYARQFREAVEKRSSNVFAKHHGPVFATTPALRVKWAEYYERLSRTYEHAANRPWEAVPPDPPEPEVFPPSSYLDY
jgi:hypothetical protein